MDGFMEIKNSIRSQFNLSRSLLDYHLNGVSDEEIMWRPNQKGLFVNEINGQWIADFPESEEYTIGPPNIAWLTWHIISFWTMVFDHSFGDGKLIQKEIRWPGDIDSVKKAIVSLANEWGETLDSLSYEDLLSRKNTKWPFENRPFHELASWLSLELMKNASEIGYCRFLYAVRSTQE